MKKKQYNVWKNGRLIDVVDTIAAARTKIEQEMTWLELNGRKWVGKQFDISAYRFWATDNKGMPVQL